MVGLLIRNPQNLRSARFGKKKSKKKKAIYIITNERKRTRKRSKFSRSTKDCSKNSREMQTNLPCWRAPSMTNKAPRRAKCKTLSPFSELTPKRSSQIQETNPRPTHHHQEQPETPTANSNLTPDLRESLGTKYPSPKSGEPTKIPRQDFDPGAPHYRQKHCRGQKVGAKIENFHWRNPRKIAFFHFPISNKPLPFSPPLLSLSLSPCNFFTCESSVLVVGKSLSLSLARAVLCYLLFKNFFSLSSSLSLFLFLFSRVCVEGVLWDGKRERGCPGEQGLPAARAQSKRPLALYRGK